MAMSSSYNPYSVESQRILERIREIRSDLNRAEDLLRQGKFGAVNELLDADFAEFTKIIRKQTHGLY